VPLLAQVPPLAETVPFPWTFSVSSTLPPGAAGVLDPNVAVTDLAAVIVTVHTELVPLHAPPQPLNSASPRGAAFRVIVVPLVALTLQVVLPSPQLIPPPLTRPVPVTETVSGNVVAPPPPPPPPEPVPVNAPETDLSLVIVNVQLVLDPEHSPPQPVKPAPAPAVALRVTLVLASTLAVQPAPPAEVQLILPSAPVTVPLPVTDTVTVCEDAPLTNPAETFLSTSSSTVQVRAVPEHEPPLQPEKS
jgi:hypothetical protein